eukprot:5093118-Heterocapsa_arctica.AAC.1
MALADGRLVQHGKHADLHRRAINAMEDRPPQDPQGQMGPVPHEGGARQGGSHIERAQGRQPRGGQAGHQGNRDAQGLQG